jgi:hypothetical protein
MKQRNGVRSGMLQCNMDTQDRLSLPLDDILGDLKHARRSGDLGRLALLAFCDLRRWARTAHRTELAEHADRLFLSAPFSDKGGFLRELDALIAEAEETLSAMNRPRTVVRAPG